MKPKLLVIDDERDLVRLVRYNLEQEGYEVYCAFDGTEALDLTWSKRPDLVILDLMLPDRPGLELCKEIKDETRKLTGQAVRVIMLTARSAERDRIAGFEAGADDYVTKPFSPRELVLRVNAMLERSEHGQPTRSQLKVGPITINKDEFRVTVADQEVHLTPIEYKILLLLAMHPNVVRTREQLLAEVWENAATEILDRTVDAHVKRLRSKLNEARELLETVRGVGYRLVDRTSSQAASA